MIKGRRKLGRIYAQPVEKRLWEESVFCLFFGKNSAIFQDFRQLLCVLFLHQST